MVCVEFTYENILFGWGDPLPQAFRTNLLYRLNPLCQIPHVRAVPFHLEDLRSRRPLTSAQSQGRVSGNRLALLAEGFRECPEVRQRTVFSAHKILPSNICVQ